MNKGKIILSVGGLILLGVGIYWQLGGFNSIRFSIKEKQNIKLLGLTYRGTPQDEQLRVTFETIEKLLNKHPEATLHTIYYTEPAGKLDTLEAFVGIEYNGLFELKDNLEILEFSCNQIIEADIQAHRLVMPSPNKVKDELEAFALNNGVTTQGIYVDKIIDKGHVKVIAPLE
jgi:hypothetical protein